MAPKANLTELEDPLPLVLDPSPSSPSLVYSTGQASHLVVFPAAPVPQYLSLHIAQLAVSAVPAEAKASYKQLVTPAVDLTSLQVSSLCLANPALHLLQAAVVPYPSSQPATTVPVAQVPPPRALNTDPLLQTVHLIVPLLSADSLQSVAPLPIKSLSQTVPLRVLPEAQE